MLNMPRLWEGREPYAKEERDRKSEKLRQKV